MTLKGHTAMSITHFINRRLLPTILSALLVVGGPAAARVPGTVVGTAAATKAPAQKKGKISADLAQELTTPGKHKGKWSKQHKGQHVVNAIVTSDASDRDMASLQAEVTALGGTVVVAHPSVKALTIALPAKALKKLAKHPDVVAIAPNRDTASTASNLEVMTGANTAAVRTYSTSTTYTGFDGTGVGIAILDSGVMKAHVSFRNASGVTRVKRNVSMVKAATTNWYDTLGNVMSSPMPGSAALATYEASIAADNDLTQDPFGHGTHVASVAAGRGFYQTPDSTGIAPNADLYDVRVLAADGTGTTSDALEGINWVIYHAREYNIKVMNLSLAASSTDPWDYDPLCHAVRAAAAVGITVVVAGGNYGLNAANQKTFGTIASPANDPTVITVGAVNYKGTNGRADDAVTNFSSRGPTRAFLDMGTWKWYDNIVKPDVVAPGNKILGANATAASATAPTKNKLATDNPQLVAASGLPMTPYAKGLIQLNGTSVAAPAVAGAAAVLLQVNPGLTPPLVKAILQYTAQPLAGASLVEQGAGQINLEGAIRLAQALRTDIASAASAGTLVHGVTGLLAAGKTLPTARSSTVAGTTFNW